MKCLLLVLLTFTGALYAADEPVKTDGKVETEVLEKTEAEKEAEAKKRPKDIFRIRIPGSHKFFAERIKRFLYYSIHF